MPAPVTSRRCCLVLAALIIALGLNAAELSDSAIAGSLQKRLDKTRVRIDSARDRGGVLSSTIARQRSRSDRLRREVARLRDRDVVLRNELTATEARLRSARAQRAEAEAELRRIRKRLAAATKRLRRFLVDAYRSGEPDIITVILESDGFDELLSRSEYASRLVEFRSTVISRVRQLQARVRRTVVRLRQAEAEIESARLAIVDRRKRLARIGSTLRSKRGGAA